MFVVYIWVQNIYIYIRMGGLVTSITRGYITTSVEIQSIGISTLDLDI